MTSTFINDCLRTEATEVYPLISEGKTYSSSRLTHASFGMQTETAEFTDALKKSMFYGKSLDVVNLKEELGDLLWYVAIAMDELDTDFSTEADRVIAKLKVRYSDKFTTSSAINRDLVVERSILEQ